MRGLLKQIWEHRYTSYVLGLASLGITVWFIFRSPEPGVAVAVLAAAAAILTFRKVSESGRFLWSLIVVGLLYAEVHAIKVDRREQIRHQLQDQAAQNDRFDGIRKTQDEDFTSTAAKLKDAIAGLGHNLDTTKLVLKQTRPRADLEYKALTAMLDNLNRPSYTSVSGQMAGVWYHWQNQGNASGQLYGALMETYVGRPDDKQEAERWSARLDLYQ